MSTTVLDTTTPTAAKAHKCVWCGQPIAKGDKYERQKMIHEGEFHDNKWHPECARASARHLDPGDEFSPYGNERGGPPI